MNKTVSIEGFSLKAYELRAVTEPLWVKDGSVSVYLQKCQNHQPVGRRQFLFSVPPGEMIWHTSPESDYQLWLEAETEAELQPIGDNLPMAALAPGCTAWAVI